MKLTFIACLSLLVFNAYGLDGSHLSEATDAAMAEADMEIDLERVVAWESKIEGDEVEVKILAVDETVLTYGCHLHGKSMGCHEEGHDHKPNTNKGGQEFDFMNEGYQAAVKVITESLGSRGEDFSVAVGVKVWKVEKNHDGHSHGDDVWTKVDYALNGKVKTAYLLCHPHSKKGQFGCHYKRKGRNEPSF